MLRLALLILIAFCANTTFSQELVSTLNGYSLGQFREIPKNNLLGLLQTDRFEDGFEYDVHLVEPDTSVYMIFEYAEYDLNTIWSAQITGSKDGYDCGFKGLKLGMKEKELRNLVGEPSTIEEVGEYGFKWSYANTNYSLEISPEKRLAGIKIIDMTHELFPSSRVELIPPYAIWIKLLTAREARTVSSILSPGIEIYQSDSTFFFQKPWSKELEEDKSGIYDLVSATAALLETIDVNDTLSYEENMRLALGADPMHVVKARTDEKYIELVFKYMFGKYLIWEIAIKDLEP